MSQYSAPNDYLSTFGQKLPREAILQTRTECALRLNDPRFVKFQDALAKAPDLQTEYFVFDEPVVRIGKADELSQHQKAALRRSLATFMPWKKGPFSIFGVDIDSEWRSDIKWERFEKFDMNLRGKVVADIGCHNGYFMYRMAPQDPALIVGFEPYPKCFFNYLLLQKYARRPNFAYELLGVEHFNLYPDFFDAIFCMGILYHHRDPVGLLEKMRDSLRPGGQIFIDCQGIEGKDSSALIPDGRYANASGIWFLPTLHGLLSWLRRAGLRKNEVIFSGPLGSDEQRSTAWAPIPSLGSFLDGKKTVEGYPGPQRFYVASSR